MTVNDTRPAGPSHIEINGTNYRLSFSVIALAALQDHWKLKDVDAVMARMNELKSGRVADLAVLFWASLQRFHPEVTPDEALALADDAGLLRIMAAIRVAGLGSSPPPAARRAVATPGKRKKPGR
jgi:hypothetical protein